MTISSIEYRLQAGYIHHWLIAGPVISPLGNTNGEAASSTGWLEKIPLPAETPFSPLPVERDSFQHSGETLIWKYQRSGLDHVLDFSSSCPTWQMTCAYAYTRLSLPADREVTFQFTAAGSVEIWVNQEKVYGPTAFASEPQSAAFSLPISAGENGVLVRLRQAAAGPFRLGFALRLPELAAASKSDQAAVLVPTHALHPHRHRRLERAFDAAYLEDVTNLRGDSFFLHWSENLAEDVRFGYQVQDLAENIYVEGDWEAKPGELLDVGHTQRLYERAYQVVLKATPREYYEQNNRCQRSLPIYVFDNPYFENPADDFAHRKLEALEAAARYPNSLFAEIARMELKRWSSLQIDVILSAVSQVERRAVGSGLLVVALLGILSRYAQAAEFPQQLVDPIQHSILNYRYGPDEPGWDGLDFSGEDHAIVFAAAGILAGQLFPKAIFTNSGRVGAELRAACEAQAQSWLQKYSRGGFRAWDSPAVCDRVLAALSHLTSLVEDILLADYAAILMDKIFFEMAVNSYKGVYASSQGAALAGMLKSAQLQATSGISRLMFGAGGLNANLAGTVSLACSTYEFPLLLADIANDLSREIWSRERQVVAGASDQIEFSVDKAAFRTADYMLASAQDYHSGEKGSSEHIWQATMGPEALVFVNHPGCASESEACQPGFWRGNAVLPRVAQWKDVLLAVYQLPETDGLGFTHAFFPTYKFEEYALRGGWAFARRADGYLALKAAAGMELVKEAPDGYRELRSTAKENIWICQMGRAEQDGSFTDFQEKILALTITQQPLSIAMDTLRGDRISFGWQGDFTINGQAQPLHGFAQYDNPYSHTDILAGQAEIAFGDTIMRLHLS